MRFVIAFLILGAVILFHEWGHFLLARASGIVVLEFAFGMGPKLFSFKRGDTTYAWKLLPFGGSCMMLGEDEDQELPGSFNGAAVWKRILTVAAGPLFNFLLAFLVSIIVIGAGGYDPARVEEVPADSPAYAAGLREGDLIVRYEGNGIANAREMYADIMIDDVPTDEITLTYQRDGKREEITYVPVTETRYLLGFFYDPEAKALEITGLTPKGALEAAGLTAGDTITALDGTAIADAEALDAYLDLHPLDGTAIEVTYLHNGRERTASVSPKVETRAGLGFAYNLAREKQSFFGTLRAAGGEIRYWIHVTVKSLLSLLTGRFSINEMSGPVGLVSTIGNVYQEAAADGTATLVLTMLNMLILLSANLGVMNLLPIPALDGGRLVFLIIEAIRGKPVNREMEGRIHFIGIVLLLGFMAYITVHDILKLF